MIAIYSTIGGTTRRVAHHVANRLGCENLAAAREALELQPGTVTGPFLLFCPTYGDAEMEHSFEQWLHHWNWASVQDKRYAFCELGIYTGYDDFSHGLIPILHSVLSPVGMRPIVEPLAIDSVPIKDWSILDAWADAIAMSIRPYE